MVRNVNIPFLSTFVGLLFKHTLSGLNLNHFWIIDLLCPSSNCHTFLDWVWTYI